MTDFLTFEKAKEMKLNMIGVVKYYWPDISDQEADSIIWEETCYPMDTDTTFRQLYKKYKNEVSSPPTDPENKV